MKAKTTSIAVPVLGLFLLLTGCAYHPYVDEERLDSGLVLVLTGIEGRSWINRQIADGLDRGGVDHAIEIVDWTSILGPVYSLRSTQRNRDEAEKIAKRIVNYRRAHPGKPVYLVGNSGGGGMALWVAEALPRGQEVDGIVLLAAAISPGYSLSEAQDHTAQGIVNFYSERDWVMLGAGTSVAGTIDGKHKSSAGRIGFDDPTDTMQAKAHEDLYQIAWQDDMSQFGHFGGHFTAGTSAYITRYVAPLIRAKYWDSQLVERVERGLPIPLKPNSRKEKRGDEWPTGGFDSQDDWRTNGW
ncbi:MAG: alpha/beta fold hydrolase [Phycisphaerae bacterium]